MKSTSTIAVLALFTSILSWAAVAPTKIELGTGSAKDKEAMVYTKDKLSVKAGSKVTIRFKNNSAAKGVTHNLVISKPGTAQAIIDASIAAGPDKGWVADSADIIAKTKLIDAGEEVTLDFIAPAEPGEYPYFCTFPGHAMMKGVMKVSK